MIRELIVVLLIAVSLIFLTLGTVGLIRLPDLFNRMHATSKATTIGAVSMFLAAAVRFGWGAGFTALVGIFFLLLTAPTGAHMIARSALRNDYSYKGLSIPSYEDGQDHRDNDDQS